MIFKTRLEYGFLQNPLVEVTVKTVAWSKRLETFVKFMSKNSISVLPFS
jgi:hypothetical protein